MRLLRGRFSQYPDPGGVTCLLLFGPGGTKCFIVPFGPLRDNPINMRPLRGLFLQLCPLRQKFPDNKCVNGLCRELENLSVL
jgi:hypothetical protein